MKYSVLSSPYRYIFLTGLLVYLVTSYFSTGFNHPDEHFQILEFCNYKLGLSPAVDLPWEFNARIRPALQPTIVYLLIKFFNLLNISNPFTHALILRILTALLSWFVISKISLLLLKDFSTESGRKLFLFLNFFLWFVPFLSVRFTSENYSAITLLGSIYLILLNKDSLNKNHLQLFWAGFLLGLSFFFRFQIAFAILGLILWIVFIQKSKWSSIILLSASGILGMLVCICIDFWFYGETLFTPYNYFYSNIIEHKAASFGISPWWSYFTWFIIQCVPPISIFLLLFFCIGGFKNPKHIFVFCLIPFLLGHIVVEHKELRFLFPMVIFFNYIAAIGIDYYFSIEKFRKYLRFIITLSLIVNTPLLLVRIFMPSQEAINYYKYLYDSAWKKQTVLISKINSPYQLGILKINFYNSPFLENIVVENDLAITDYLNEKSPSDVLILERNLNNAHEYKSYKIESTYCIYPDWILRININDWQSRSKIWKIIKLKRTE